MAEKKNCWQVSVKKTKQQEQKMETSILFSSSFPPILGHGTTISKTKPMTAILYGQM